MSENMHCSFVCLCSLHTHTRIQRYENHICCIDTFWRCLQINRHMVPNQYIVRLCQNEIKWQTWLEQRAKEKKWEKRAKHTDPHKERNLKKVEKFPEYNRMDRGDFVKKNCAEQPAQNGNQLFCVAFYSRYCLHKKFEFIHSYGTKNLSFPVEFICCYYYNFFLLLLLFGVMFEMSICRFCVLTKCLRGIRHNSFFLVIHNFKVK